MACQGDGILTTDDYDELFSKHINVNVVPDPSGEKGLLDISKMKEKNLAVLFDQTWAKAKRIKTKHSSKHGWLLNCATILRRLYLINLHKWARDEGRSGVSLEGFEEYFKGGLDPSKRGKH